MIIQRIRPLANDHPEDPASCKWPSRGSGLLHMIIRRIRPLANDHLEESASCKWSSEGSSLLQMIIQRISPLANDHPENLATCIWSSGGSGLLQMIICHPRLPNHLSQDPDLISRSFLEQSALVSKYSPAVLMICKVFKDHCSWFAEFLKSTTLDLQNF